MTRRFRLASVGCRAFAGALALVPLATHAQASPHYRIAHELPLPGDEGWDYLAFEAGGHRLFVSHGTRVLVVDTDKLALAGEIADTPGVHGIALAPDLGRGYISAGGAGVIVVFDLKTLARLKEIKATGETPDAILYDAASQRVFTFNGRGRNATAVDARTDAVIGTIALDAKPEFAVADGKGRIYVNLEDKGSLAVIDPHKLSVISVWPISGCQEPSGLALDAAGGHLFPVCANKVMAGVDGASRHVCRRAPLGGGGGRAGVGTQRRTACAPRGAGGLP